MVKGGKYIAMAIAAILVIGVVIGVVVGITHHNKSHKDVDDETALSSTSKSIASICSQTDFKKTCVQSLSSLVNNDTATPKDYFETAIRVTMEELKALMAKSGLINSIRLDDPPQKNATDSCQALLQYAVDELEESVSTIGSSELHNMSERAADLNNWLSAVVSYQDTCVEQFTQPEWKQTVSNGLVNATQLTVNALAMVSIISEIVKDLRIPVKTGNRKLLQTPTPLDRNGYPAWITDADRKLLASNNNAGLTPNAVVAQDGSGQYKTIGEAVAAYPAANSKNPNSRYVIYVKAGIYREYVLIDKDKTNVFIYGDGPRKTIVTGSKSMAGSGLAPFMSATFATIGTGCIVKSMGFQNTAGPEGHQAVALRSQSDMSVYYNCRIDGYQDTLYAQTHRQFYRNCVISGTVDFIFGDSATIIQNSLIIARKPMDGQQNTVTAHGRSQNRETTGLVIQNCRIVPEQKLAPERFQIQTYLGRPWKQYSRTVIIESTLGDFIQPAGWMEWSGNFALDTLFYAEYANRGPGANTARRVRWKGYKVITDRNEALQYTAGPFIQGDQWLQKTDIPHMMGLRY